MDKRIIAILLVVGMVLIEANIQKRAVLSNLHARRQKKAQGIQEGDTELCQFIENGVVPDWMDICDTGPGYTKYCYLKAWNCDKSLDCFDESDEKDCDKKGKGKGKGRKNKGKKVKN